VDEKWFTVEEVADQLRVHEQTVRRWLREGKLQGANFGGKTGWRIRGRALDEFIRDVEGKVTAA
jgi:excisionase family DNA binding protein